MGNRAALWLLGAGLLFCAAAAVFAQLPLPPALLSYRSLQSVRILDRSGGLLREVPPGEEGSARPLQATDVPAHLRWAVLAAEDANFFSHRGISWPAIARAAWQNLRARRVMAGGSTLTQQLARNLLHRPRGVWGKLWEALWAVRLEAQLSKEEILLQYLNRVPLGNRTFGVEAASQLYFGRAARTLSVGQAALLAAIPKGPSAYNPYRKWERLEARRRWVVGRMLKVRALTAKGAVEARSSPLDLQISSAAFSAPHFVERLASQLGEGQWPSAIELRTSLDPKLQREVEEVVSEEMARLAERRVTSAAVLVLDNFSGEVLAYAGSPDFFDEEHGGQNDGVQMRRQPGSALKPFLYAEAFSRGYTAASVLADVETAYGAEKGAYAPQNYDRREHGPVRAREALANSFNVPAVQLAAALGADRLLETLHRAGLASLSQPAAHYGLGLALGNGEVSLWELARAYAGLSRGGVLKPLRPILEARGSDGTVLPLNDEVPFQRFLSPSSSALVTDILSDNAARARAFGLDSALRLPFPVAAKTGTSKGYSDNWTVGYARERTVAVWAGNFDGSSMVQVSGVTGAGPIFKRVMLKAMEGISPLPLNSNVSLEQAGLCPLSGELAGPDCPSTMEERFAPGTAPTQRCSQHQRISEALSHEEQGRCLKLSQGTGRLTRIEPRYLKWAAEEGVTPAPGFTERCMGWKEKSAAPQLLSPSSGDEYLLFSDMPGKDQMVPVRIWAQAQEGALELWLDEQRVATLEPPFTGKIPAQKGDHLLAVKRRGSGEAVASARFRVRTERSRW